MPVPRRRHCPSRQGKRRSHIKLKARNLVECDNCGNLKLPNRVCPVCGTFEKRDYSEPQDNPYTI